MCISVFGFLAKVQYYSASSWHFVMEWRQNLVFWRIMICSWDSWYALGIADMSAMLIISAMMIRVNAMLGFQGALKLTPCVKLCEIFVLFQSAKHIRLSVFQRKCVNVCPYKVPLSILHAPLFTAVLTETCAMSVRTRFGSRHTCERSSNKQFPHIS